jgi:4-hydroxybenzoate polyprenyltransferase
MSIKKPGIPPPTSPPTILGGIYPYLELARLDRPVGIPLIVFPYFYGFFYALITANPSSINPSYPFTFRLPLLLISGSILRSVGCAWNDIVDADIDSRVQRTRHRPIARGAISRSLACLFTAFLWVVWISTITPLLPERQSQGLYAIPLVTMVTVYPYCKRFTYYAQVFLGFTLGWGVLFGAAMAGFDVLEQVYCGWDGYEFAREPRVQGVFAMYAAYVVWTVIYDTIYAYQDIAGDRKIGMKSMALRLGGHAKSILGCLTLLMVVLLGFVGKPAIKLRSYEALPFVKEAWPFILFVLLPSGLLHSVMLAKVDLTSPESCGTWFKRVSTVFGFSMAFWLVGQYALST